MAKPRRTHPSKETPLDVKKRALLDQERMLREKMQKAEQIITDAPRKQEELEKRRREELITRSGKNLRRMDATTLLDRRNYEHKLHTSLTAGRPRILKSEKKQARLKFFGLCVIFAFLIVWLCSRFM
jgi:hypothetical protein